MNMNGFKLFKSLSCATLVCSLSVPFVGTGAFAAPLSREQIMAQNRALEDGDYVAPAPEKTNSQITALSAPRATQAPALQAPASQAPAPVGAAPASGNGDLLSRLLDRVDHQDDLIRDLRGRVEILENQVAQKSAQSEKDLGDLKFQLDALKTDIAEKLKNAKAREVKAAPDLIGTAERAANAAKTPQAKADAKYKLAQAYMGAKSYRPAAVAYFDAYKAAPKSGTAPKALLGVAQVMSALNNKVAACQAFGKLEREFPNFKAPKFREKC